MAERDYAYPAKDMVREAWMRFLPPDLSNPTDTGLYLPAEQNLELPGYLRKRMKPGQLIGAEHDLVRFPAVQANAGGIHLVRGSIIDAIYYCEERGLPRLRLANLDFDGTLHTFIEELLALARIFPSHRGSYLSVTSYAARDLGALMQGNVNACKFYSGLPTTQMFLTAYSVMVGRFELLLRLFPHHESTAQAHVQRELELLWWLVLMLAVIEPFTDGPLSVFDQQFIDQLDELSSAITQDVHRQIDGLGRADQPVFVANRDVRDVLAARPVCWWVNDLQRFAYSSRNRQPMRTWNFRIVRTERGQRETAQDLLEQVWTLASRAPLVYVDTQGEQVVIGGLQK